MKNVFVFCMTALLLLCLTACGQTDGGKDMADESVSASAADETTALLVTGEQMQNVGGWTRVSSPVVPENVHALLDQAAASYDGASFSPVALLESQVVAGTNYRILCTMQPAGSMEAQTYAIVDLYTDLQGNAEITDVRNSDVETSWLGLSGGWFSVESPEITAEIGAAFDKALQTASAQYTPVACLSQQVVAGMNYLLLAQDAQSEYVFVRMYVDLQGGAEITDTTAFR